MLIDTHCHINMHRFNEDREQLIQTCLDKELSGMVVIGAGDDEKLNEPALELARAYDFIWATVGVHPHDAKVCTEATFERCAAWAEAEPKVVGIGETGLDFFYDHSDREIQQDVFRRFVGLARAVKLPLVIHDRDAHEQTLAILTQEKARDVGGVVHCFSGDLEFAKQVVDLGFFLGITGIVTFRKADDLQQVAREISLAHLVVETDAPYLAPIPYRGKRNEPWMVRYVAEKIAELRGIGVDEVIEATVRNTERLFGVKIR